MSSEDPRERAAEDYLLATFGIGTNARGLLEVIDRAKDREIARLRKLLDDAGIPR